MAVKRDENIVNLEVRYKTGTKRNFKDLSLNWCYAEPKGSQKLILKFEHQNWHFSFFSKKWNVLSQNKYSDNVQMLTKYKMIQSEITLTLS